MNDNSNIWRFCVVGNIKKQHIDIENNILYGTPKFVGGTKVYIDDKTFNLNTGSVGVIGLNRYGRYTVERVPIDLIENIRVQRVYKPKVLKIMNYLETSDGWSWSGRTTGEIKLLHTFVSAWKNQQSNNM